MNSDFFSNKYLGTKIPMDFLSGEGDELLGLANDYQSTSFLIPVEGVKDYVSLDFVNSQNQFTLVLATTSREIKTYLSKFTIENQNKFMLGVFNECNIHQLRGELFTLVKDRTCHLFSLIQLKGTYFIHASKGGN